MTFSARQSGNTHRYCRTLRWTAFTRIDDQRTVGPNPISPDHNEFPIKGNRKKKSVSSPQKGASSNIVEGQSYGSRKVRQDENLRPVPRSGRMIFVILSGLQSCLEVERAMLRRSPTAVMVVDRVDERHRNTSLRCDKQYPHEHQAQSDPRKSWI